MGPRYVSSSAKPLHFSGEDVHREAVSTDLVERQTVMTAGMSAAERFEL